MWKQRILLSLLALVKCSGIIRLLLIGSSVDRIMVMELCKEYRNVEGDEYDLYIWGNNSLIENNKKYHNPPTMCNGTNFHVISVQVFGSKQSGPYYHGLENRPDNIFIETNNRIRLIFHLYKEEFGRLPDRVIFSSALWDCAYFEVDDNVTSAQHYKENVARYLDVFSHDINSRINEILALVGSESHVDVGLRTDVWSERRVNSDAWEDAEFVAQADMMHGHNRIVRELAAERNLTLYDFDADIWGLFGYNLSFSSEVFRDHIHPRPHFIIGGVLKMLGLRYSQHMHFGATANGGQSERRHMLDSLLTRNNATKFMQGTLLVDGGAGDDRFGLSQLPQDFKASLFFFDSFRMSRHVVMRKRFLDVIYSSRGDVMTVRGEHLSEIPLGRAVPDIFHENRFYGPQSNGMAWFIHAKKKWAVDKPDRIASIKVSPALDLRTVPCDERDCYFHRFVDWGGELITAVYSIDIALIRYKNTKQVYIARDGKRSLVHNAHEIEQLNKTFDDVIQVEKSVLLEFLLPVTGAPQQSQEQAHEAAKHSDKGPALAAKHAAVNSEKTASDLRHKTKSELQPGAEAAPEIYTAPKAPRSNTHRSSAGSSSSRSSSSGSGSGSGSGSSDSTNSRISRTRGKNTYITSAFNSEPWASVRVRGAAANPAVLDRRPRAPGSGS